MKRLTTQLFSRKRRIQLTVLLTVLALAGMTVVVSSVQIQITPANNPTFAQGANDGRTVGAVGKVGMTPALRPRASRIRITRIHLSRPRHPPM
jgi:hypothetical protein